MQHNQLHSIEVYLFNTVMNSSAVGDVSAILTYMTSSTKCHDLLTSWPRQKFYKSDRSLYVESHVSLNMDVTRTFDIFTLTILRNDVLWWWRWSWHYSTHWWTADIWTTWRRLLTTSCLCRRFRLRRRRRCCCTATGVVLNISHAYITSCTPLNATGYFW